MRDEDDLRRRLLLASARLDIEEIAPHEAVMLACDLLAGGASGEATLELAMQSTARLSRDHAEVLLRRVLVEWGIEPPIQPQSGAIVALDLCRRLLDRTLAPEKAGHRLLGALAGGGSRAHVDRLLHLLDRLEDDLAGRADGAFRADLDTLARDILHGVVRP